MHITARDGAGLFYGAITAWQLLTADSNQGPTEIPTVTIHDWPRFKWRGQLLDVARHFHDVDTVKHVIDAMAQHKLNVLHLHLTDDQGWRIEIKRYPKLTAIGAERIPPGAGRHGTPERYGGFYTQDQIRELVAYATERQITILPEIDMPGHAQAAVAAYPDIIGVTSTTPPVSVDWGVNPYLFGTSTPSLDFIRNVLDEVLTLFPSQYIHIGGDEAVKDQWEASHTIRAQMRKLGVKDTHAMQGWLNTQLAQYLTTHDRRLIGWDEIIQSGLPESASVMSWRGVEGAITAAQQGHDVVLAPAGWMYLDNLQTERSDEPNGRLATLPLSRVYTLDPVPKELTPDQAIHILGLQSALWSEYIPSRWHIDHALFPRLAAVAEVAWSPMTARNWDNFLKRLPHNYTATAPCTSTTATAHSPPTSCCNTAQPTSLLANPLTSHSATKPTPAKFTTPQTATNRPYIPPLHRPISHHPPHHSQSSRIHRRRPPPGRHPQPHLRPQHTAECGHPRITQLLRQRTTGITPPPATRHARPQHPRVQRRPIPRLLDRPPNTPQQHTSHPHRRRTPSTQLRPGPRPIQSHSISQTHRTRRTGNPHRLQQKTTGRDPPPARRHHRRTIHPRRPITTDHRRPRPVPTHHRPHPRPTVCHWSRPTDPRHPRITSAPTH